MTWIQKHFEGYRKRQPWDFCWRLGIESTLASLVAASLLAIVFDSEQREILNLPIGVVFLAIIVIAPPLETLLLQAFPIFVVRVLKGSFGAQVIISTIFFAVCHLPEGVATFISAGIVGGLYFGFACAHWRMKSRWKSFWVTTGCHVIHNGIAFILLVALGNWS